MELAQQASNTVPFTEEQLDQLDWSSLVQMHQQFEQETMGQKLPKPYEQPERLMLLAAGGISFQTQRAINELDKSFEKPASSPSIPTATYSGGRDTQATQDWRGRTAADQAAERERLMRKQRELSRTLSRQGA